ncbi:hypothetical protein [Pontimicrobium sp. MEBiC01747]|jgi:hypothetical protein
MKTQNSKQLQFNKKSVSELNSKMLIKVKGGTHTTLPSDIRCTFLVTSSGGTTFSKIQ